MATHPVVAVGAIIFDGTRVLIVKRGREPLKGRWSLPGGRVELGEPLESAVCREALEETGLMTEVERFVTVLDRISRDESGVVQYHFVLADFRCRVLGGTLRAGDDADEVMWVEVDDLARHGVAQFTIDVIRMARSA